MPVPELVCGRRRGQFLRRYVALPLDLWVSFGLGVVSGEVVAS